MLIFNKRLALLLFLIWSCHLLSIAQNTRQLSPLNGVGFEKGVPKMVYCTQGKLSTSNNHYAQGRYSLRWDYVPGDTLVILGKIGYIEQKREIPKQILEDTFLLTQEPVGFEFPIYMEKSEDALLHFMFGRGDTVDCSIDFRLDYQGWRRFRTTYDRGHLTGRPRNNMNSLIIKALSNSSGTVYFDNLVFSKRMNPRLVLPTRLAPSITFHPQRKVGATGHLIRNDRYLNRPWFPLPNTVTREEKSAFQTIHHRLLAIEWDIEDKHEQLRKPLMKSLKEEFRYFRLQRGPSGHVNGLHLTDGKDRARFCQLIKKIALYYTTLEEGGQKELLSAYLTLMIEHGIETDTNLNWYHGRGFAEGCYLGKEVLRKKGLLDKAVRFIRRKYDFNRIYDEDTPRGVHGGRGVSSDHLYTNSIGMLLCVLILDDGPKKVRDMQHFSSWYSNIAFNYAPGLSDTFKPDGSHYHHANAYLIRYGNYTMKEVTKLIRLIAQTPFRIQSEAHERMKHNLMVRRFCRSRSYYPWAYAHNLIRPDESTYPIELLHLALAGTPDGSQAVDREVAAAYLRAVPKGENNEHIASLKSIGIVPESEPQGHHTLSYYAKAVHRRGDWMTVIGAFSRYIYQTESWHWKRGNIRLNQFVNWGTMEVIHPDKQGHPFVNNGWELNGWDWCRFPGSTAFKAPFERIKTLPLKNGDDLDEHLRSDQAFVGGLSMGNGDGVFTTTVRGHDKYKLDSFRATKSWFFFDDLIVCLGTGIDNDLSKYETETTLFQNSLSHTDRPVLLGNRHGIRYSPQQDSLVTTEGTWLVDGRAVGYYLTEGQELSFKSGVQISRDAKDELDTQGEFELCYLRHGKAPQSARYEYAMKINTDTVSMRAFAVKMQENKKAPYTVERADQGAHIVHCTDKRTTAYILFRKDYELNHGHLKGVSHSAILSLRDADEHLVLSISDPDLRLYEGFGADTDLALRRHETPPYGHYWFHQESIPSTIKVFLHGQWELDASLKGNGKIIQTVNNVTVVEFQCQHGLTSELRLKKVKPKK